MKRIYFFLLFFLGISFYLRINYWPLYQKFGFYQGDIWYFYTHYGEQIKSSFFFQIEYPVGFILIQKLAFFLTKSIFSKDNYETFLVSNAILIIPAVVGVFSLIEKISSHLKMNSRLTMIYLLLSPSLFIYSSINYDIFPVFLSLVSVWFLIKKRIYLSMFILSLGAVIKFYPILLVPIFVIYLLSRGILLSKIVTALLVFIITFSAINLPYFIYNRDFWLFPYTYQSVNPERIDPTTISYFLFVKTGLEKYQLLLLPTLVLFSWVLSFSVYKKKKLTDKNFIFLLLLGVFSIVLGNHIYVPQYLLWFLPFLSLLQLPNFFIWWPLDLLNASTRFFYFKLLNDFKPTFTLLRELTVFYYLLFYLFLIYYVFRLSADEN